MGFNLQLVRVFEPAPILQVKLPDIHNWTVSRELHIHSVIYVITDAKSDEAGEVK